jgi:hypothetical protein
VVGKKKYRRRQGMYHMWQIKKKNVKRKYNTFVMKRKNMKQNGQPMLTK